MGGDWVLHINCSEGGPWSNQAYSSLWGLGRGQVHNIGFLFAWSYTAQIINFSNVSGWHGQAECIFSCIGPALSGPVNYSDRPGLAQITRQ